jgi:Protein of unknown function (DUF1549)/Protein of unknown function (DUF1553)
MQARFVCLVVVGLAGFFFATGVVLADKNDKKTPSKTSSKTPAKAPEPAKPAPPKIGASKLEKTSFPASVSTPPKGPVMKVAAIDRSNHDSIREAAAKIDAFILKGLADSGQKPQPNLKDEQFLRRIYLELGGRIPSFGEALAFVNSKSKEKRIDLIDTILESPDYVSHFYNYWADVLRLTERPNNNIIFEPYLAYVKESIAENKPYDKWVHEMLTANGKVWENPAVGFQIRDEGMPLPYIDNTIRVLLGKQIGCAQCHDHPFDSWTQKQFYELAAFTAGTRTRLSKSDPEMKGGMSSGELIKEARARTSDGKLKGPFQNVVNANTYAIKFSNKDLKLPHDYQYSDGKPNEVVKPKVLWDDIPMTAAKADRREQFAAWVTGRQNRQFARNIANRMWKKMMGLGIVEPIDDFRDENAPSHPELLEHLTDEVLRLNFDLRELARIIANTQSFQRLAAVHDPSSTEPYRFPGPVLHRMTAEQLWDSLLTLVAYNHWSYQRPGAKELAPIVDMDWTKANVDLAQSITDKYDTTYAPGIYNREIQKLCGFEGQLLVRASEIPTPVPLGHFLRQFGQSDRETIEGGRTVATVPQILTMFNGPITHIMLKKGSVIYDNVVQAGSANAIDVMFLSILSHRPSITDRELAIREVKSAERAEAGYGNVLWALLNTREFLFVQ